MAPPALRPDLKYMFSLQGQIQSLRSICTSGPLLLSPLRLLAACCRFKTRCLGLGVSHARHTSRLL
jgi:hypothetical protein